MSFHLKKRARGWEETKEELEKAESDSGSEEESESGSEDGDDEKEDRESDWSSDFDPKMEVKVQFEVHPIRDEHRPAIRRLLQQLLLKGSVDISGLTELLLSQDGIGSVIQVESELKEGSDCNGVSDVSDCNGVSGEEEEGIERTESLGDRDNDDDKEDEVCGVVSVINLTHHTNTAVQSLTHHLLAQCKKHSSTSTHTQLTQLLASSQSEGHIGLLVNERYLNIPPHIVPPLLETLLGEVKEASGKGLPYNFSNFVFLARSYTVPSPVSSSPCSKRQRTDDTVKEKEKTETKVRGERGSCTMSSLSVLHCQEYEILQEESILTFTYPVSGEGSVCGGGGGGGDNVFGGQWKHDDDSLQQTRTVMIIPASQLQSLLHKLTSLLT